MSSTPYMASRNLCRDSVSLHVSHPGLALSTVFRNTSFAAAPLATAEALTRAAVLCLCLRLCRTPTPQLPPTHDPQNLAPESWARPWLLDRSPGPRLLTASLQKHARLHNFLQEQSCTLGSRVCRHVPDLPTCRCTPRLTNEGTPIRPGFGRCYRRWHSGATRDGIV